jgi:phosphatidylglycerol:prolipoprotein diacylglycerol transferase
MPAVLTFAFDPLAHVGGLDVRFETIAQAAILLAALLLLTRIGRITPTEGPYVPAPTLRPIDVPFLVLGVVPGAVIGGRLDYVLVHLDYYRAHPAAIVDPSQGSLGLGLAVPGAVIGAAILGRLVDAPVRRWFHAATLPTLFVLAATKLAAVLAADGQGMPSDLPWATAYIGDGPWSSLAAYVPSHPSQVYEAVATVAVLIVVGIAFRRGVFADRDGTGLFVAVGLWAAGRGIVALTWRDASVAGPFGAEQLILAALIVACAVIVVLVRRRQASAPA